MDRLPSGKIPKCPKCNWFGDLLEYKGREDKFVPFRNPALKGGVNIVAYKFHCPNCKQDFQIQPKKT